MSLRASAGRPATCSGERYPTVPSTTPGSVSASPAVDWAMPKSVTFTSAVGVTSTLLGFTSRCTIP